MDNSQLDALYLEHYQFRFDPFSGKGNAFQFFKARRRGVLEQLAHFARYGDFLLLVTGPRESGKTVLRHALAASTGESARSVVISAAQAREAGTLIRHIAHELQGSYTDLTGLLETLGQHVASGQSIHILVDDAHLLGDSAIMLLQRLSRGSGKARASVFLFGEPSLQTLVDGISQGHDEVGHHLIELEPWSATEIQAFLQGRLEAAGRSLDVFTDAELERICVESEGWPGRINSIAKEILLARIFDQPVPGRLSPLPYKHLLALLVIAFLFVFVLYQQDGKKKEDSTLTAPKAAVERVAVNGPHVTQQADPVRTERVPLPLPLEPAEPETGGQEPVAGQPVVVEKPVSAAPVFVEEELRQAEPAVVEPKQAPAAAVQPQQPAITEKAAAKPARQAPKPPAKPAGAVQGGYAWFAQQPASHYTLQVFASGSEQTARRAVQKYGGQYHYFRKRHQGKYLYVVTYGSFSSQAEAAAAASKLPADFQGKPWARTFASIVKEID